MQRLIKRIFSKRALFILCFVVLNIIELLRSGPAGTVWYVANNCTGIAMMFLVFSGYRLRNFMTISNYIWTAICVAFMIFLPFHWRNHIGEYLLWQVETAVLNVWWIFIVAKYQLRCIFIEKSLKVKFNVTSIVWIAMMLFMALSVNEYRVWPLWFLFMFGVFYITPYTSEDRELLWSSMLDGSIVGFFVLQIYAYGFRPYDTLRYSGYAAGSNVAAQYYLVIYVLCLCKLYQLEMKKSKIGWKIFYLLGAGGMLCFQLLTLSRGAWLVSAVVTLLYGILVIKKLWNKKWKQVILSWIIVALFMVITFLPVFYTCRYLPTISPRRVWYEREYFEPSLIHSGDPADSDKYTDLEEALELIFGRLIDTVKSIQARSPFVMRVYATEGPKVVEMVELEWLTDLSSIFRLTIYETYLSDLKWRGHLSADGILYLEGGYLLALHGHNLWVHIAFFYGIPVGILLIGITVLLFKDNYKKMFLYKEKWYSIIPFFVCVSFFGCGITESVWYVGHILMYLIFFVQLPMVTKQNENCIK